MRRQYLSRQAIICFPELFLHTVCNSWTIHLGQGLSVRAEYHDKGQPLNIREYLPEVLGILMRVRVLVGQIIK